MRILSTRIPPAHPQFSPQSAAVATPSRTLGSLTTHYSPAASVTGGIGVGDRGGVGVRTVLMFGAGLGRGFHLYVGWSHEQHIRGQLTKVVKQAAGSRQVAAGSNRQQKAGR